MNRIDDRDVPFAPIPTAPHEVPAGGSEGHPFGLALAALGIGVIAALAAGPPSGLLVYSATAADCYNDGWCELGAAIYGLFAGCLVAIIAHVTAGVLYIRRQRESGRRATMIAAHLGLSVVLVGLVLVVVGV